MPAVACELARSTLICSTAGSAFDVDDALTPQQIIVEFVRSADVEQRVSLGEYKVRSGKLRGRSGGFAAAICNAGKTPICLRSRIRFASLASMPAA